MKMRSAGGNEVEISDDALLALKSRLRGPFHRPGETAWEEARTVWNAMIDRRPALVVRPLGVADVVECVNFARERGVLISIKGGGHNIAGLAVCDGGLLLDLSLMRGVHVDPEQRGGRGPQLIRSRGRE